MVSKLSKGLKFKVVLAFFPFIPGQPIYFSHGLRLSFLTMFGLEFLTTLFCLTTHDLVEAVSKVDSLQELAQSLQNNFPLENKIDYT